MTIVIPDRSDALSLGTQKLPSPGGVQVERVDPYTLQVMETLFPGHHGLKILAAILRLAEVKQLALPELSLPDITDVAVVCVQTLRELSKRIQLSYDTTEKYILVLTKLKLLLKKRKDGQLLLHFPLSSCQLAAADSLDDLVHLRPKVQTFVTQVRRRFVLLAQKSDLYPVPHTVYGTRQFSSLLLEDINRILEEEKVDPQIKSRLFARIEGAVYYRCTRKSSLPDEKDDFPLEEDTSKSRLYARKGDFLRAADQTSSTKSLLPAQKGDFSEREASSEGLLSVRKDDFSIPTDTQESTSSDQKGDFSQREGAQSGSKSRLSDQKRDSLLQKGDFSASSDGTTSPNVNVILKDITKEINVNVAGVTNTVRTLLGEAPNKWGYYKNLYTTQHCQDAGAWLAALVETLIAMDRHSRNPGQLFDPGRYFFKRCIDLHKNGVPLATVQLVAAYGDLTHEQMVQALHAEKTVVASKHVLPAAVVPPKVKSTAPEPQVPHEPQRAAMSSGDLRLVMQRLKHNSKTSLFNVRTFRQQDGTFALLVEALSHQCWLYSLQECQARFDQLNRPMDFFLTPTK